MQMSMVLSAYTCLNLVPQRVINSIHSSQLITFTFLRYVIIVIADSIVNTNGVDFADTDTTGLIIINGKLLCNSLM